MPYTAEEIKQAIISLPETEYVNLRDWFVDRDWENWDKKIKEDSDSGRLDFLEREALAEKRKGSLKAL